ncbi:hypothetical protein HDV02_004817 [Globomyces sp. JEL0801]|nr:hypothetical protein HDV02_004817 [Globomyces sp. JEL0801]
MQLIFVFIASVISNPIHRSQSSTFKCPAGDQVVTKPTVINAQTALEVCKQCSGAECSDRKDGFVLSTDQTKPAQVFIYANNAFGADITNIQSFPGQTYMGLPTSPTAFIFSPKDLWSDAKTTLRIPKSNRINEEKDFKPVLLDSTFQCPGSYKTVKQVSKSVLGVQAALFACQSCFKHCIASDTGLVVDKTGTKQFVYGPTRGNPFSAPGSVFTYTQKDFVFNLQRENDWTA